GVVALEKRRVELLSQGVTFFDVIVVAAYDRDAEKRRIRSDKHKLVLLEISIEPPNSTSPLAKRRHTLSRMVTGHRLTKGLVVVVLSQVAEGWPADRDAMLCPKCWPELAILPRRQYPIVSHIHLRRSSKPCGF